MLSKLTVSLKNPSFRHFSQLAKQHKVLPFSPSKQRGKYYLGRGLRPSNYPNFIVFTSSCTASPDLAKARFSSVVSSSSMSFLPSLTGTPMTVSLKEGKNHYANYPTMRLILGCGGD